jgi:hypothetical protein
MSIHSASSPLNRLLVLSIAMFLLGCGGRKPTAKFDVEVDHDKLFEAYVTNELKADSVYGGGKLVKMKSGMVSSKTIIHRDGSGKFFVPLVAAVGISGDEAFSVKCYIADRAKADFAKLEPGDMGVEIIGKVQGTQPEPRYWKGRALIVTDCVLARIPELGQNRPPPKPNK